MTGAARQTRKDVVVVTELDLLRRIGFAVFGGVNGHAQATVAISAVDRRVVVPSRPAHDRHHD